MKPKKPKVFIERAAPLTVEGIKAICGTEEEYVKFVDELVKAKVSHKENKK